jgi:hypothetical protein
LGEIQMTFAVICVFAVAADLVPEADATIHSPATVARVKMAIAEFEKKKDKGQLIKVLSKSLGDEDAWMISLRAALLLGKEAESLDRHFGELLGGPNKIKKCAAAIIVGKLRLYPKKYVKQLVGMLEHSEEFGVAFKALVLYGESGVPPLLDSLDAQSPVTQYWVLHVFEELGAIATASVPSVARLTMSPNRIVRQKARRVLVTIICDVIARHVPWQ